FVAVLSYDYWANELGSDATVLNQSIRVNGQQMTIVGVAPKGFDGTTLGVRPKVFVPISMRAVVDHGFDGLEDRHSYWVYLFARLDPGVSIEQARASINAVYQRIINGVEAPTLTGVDDKFVRQFRSKRITLENGSRGQSSVRADVRAPLVLLFTTTGIVLLIACANIANLLSARATSRAPEITVRVALGASRWHLVQQLMAESCVLAVCGGVASLFLGRWVLASAVALMPSDMALLFDPQLHIPALLFTA